MKVFCTKYAMTNGIQEFEVEETHSPDMVRVSASLLLHGEGRNWHRTRESAIKRANQMRAAKIASLVKQIQKIEELQFN